jgi:7-cyano-7-deazaguanine synthase
MCSIFGAIGLSIDEEMVQRISVRAKDRGRDGGRIQRFQLEGCCELFLGNCRATPTTELEVAPSQPYDGIIHNGIIANDVELGNVNGLVDSMILPQIIDRSSLDMIVNSVAKIRGSYAMVIRGDDTAFAVVNYKPLYLLRKDGTIYFSSMERHLSPECSFGERPVPLEPYTAVDLRSGETRPLPRQENNKVLVICSGGLDSTTGAYVLREQGYDVSLLHFLYGCKAEPQEVKTMRHIGEHLNAEVIYQAIDYTSLSGSSPLLTNGHVADGVAGAEFASEWVPARNLVMLAHATAYAEANNFTTIALGNNLEESGSYPDNEEEFTTLFSAVLNYAVADGRRVRIVTPVGNLMKHEIVALGHRLGVPYELTWSCYRGGTEHCGKCGPCFMRYTAFQRNNLQDPSIRELVV